MRAGLAAPPLAPGLYGENMAPFPEEVDVFSAPHWRMKQLVGLYCDKVSVSGGLCAALLRREGGFRECAAVSALPPRRQLLRTAAASGLLGAPALSAAASGAGGVAFPAAPHALLGALRAGPGL